ncbi:hypothetical protein LIER_03933 [Lithospermum erythrorhizon]|uniref:Reverse transcriptase domain-containing protein n=1 Tax=Lithospermum erythrorhizon TaxID=34254 RepID=A0AAV3NV36_LITER
MPKFKTFSGIGDPSNHLKFFDSQLSFWASDDEYWPQATRNELSKLVIQYIKLEEVKLLSEEMAEIRAKGKKPVDEWQHGSPKKGRVWDRLQRPKDNSSFKRTHLKSRWREEARIPGTHADLGGNHYTPLKALVGRIFAQMEDKKALPIPQRIKAIPHRRDLKKYFKYHKDHGHDTDDCRLLKAEIEKLIRRGKLREFVKNYQKGSPRGYREPFPRRHVNDRRGNDRSPQITGRVDTISGGIAG